MDYTLERGFVPGFGQVEKVMVDGRWVGMVYKDPKPPAEFDELWMAYTQGGHGVETREDGIKAVLEHAAANPDFEME